MPLPSASVLKPVAARRPRHPHDIGSCGAGSRCLGSRSAGLQSRDHCWTTRRRPGSAGRARDPRARQRRQRLVGARQSAHRVLRRARRHRLGVGRDRRTAARRADRGSDSARRSRPRRRSSPRAEAARRRGRPTAGRCWSRVCRIRIRSTTAIRSAAKPPPPPLFATTRAFQLWRVPAPLPVHEDGGARHRRHHADAGAVRRRLRSRVADAARSLLLLGRGRRGVDAAARQVPAAARAPAKNEAELEAILDQMIGEQPLIKPVDHVLRRGRRLGPSARVGGRPSRARTRRQHRRRDGRRRRSRSAWSSRKRRASAATARRCCISRG